MNKKKKKKTTFQVLLEYPLLYSPPRSEFGGSPSKVTPPRSDFGKSASKGIIFFSFFSLPMSCLWKKKKP